MPQIMGRPFLVVSALFCSAICVRGMLGAGGRVLLDSCPPPTCNLRAERASSSAGPGPLKNAGPEGPSDRPQGVPGVRGEHPLRADIYMYVKNL